MEQIRIFVGIIRWECD